MQKRYYNPSMVQMPTDLKLTEQFDFKKYGYQLNQISRNGYSMDLFGDKITGLVYRQHSEDTDDSFYQGVFFHPNGQIKQFHSVTVKEGVKYEHQLLKDELGDTTKMEYWIDYRRNGLCVEKFHPHNENIKFYSVWKNDTLVDVLNSTFLFVDLKERVITKKAYCRGLYHDINSYWTYRIIPENIQKQYDIAYKVILSSKVTLPSFFLENESRKTDDEVLEVFLKKNRKRIEALGGRKNNL